MQHDGVVKPGEMTSLAERAGYLQALRAGFAYADLEMDGLDASGYLAWLRANAVRFVALPAAELDYSARAEAAAAARSAAPAC